MERGKGNGLQPRFHDLIIERDDSYWTMCDETRTKDLSALDGFSEARVLGTAIRHVSATGARLFEWSPFDHFAITDLAASERDALDRPNLPRHRPENRPSCADLN